MDSKRMFLHDIRILHKNAIFIAITANLHREQ